MDGWQDGASRCSSQRAALSPRRRVARSRIQRQFPLLCPMKHAVYGLTGGIACGKSTVAALFAEWGASVVDADQVARDVVLPGTPGLARLVETFGPSILDDTGALRRERLGALVFSDSGMRGKLDAIMHPLIAAESARRMAAALGSTRVPVFYEAALLVETGRGGDFPGLVVVACSPEVQLRRLLARNPDLGVDGARDRISSQMSVQDKVAAATWTIWNDGDHAALREASRRVFDAVLAHEPT
jgi:dephospho-CoA kinase